MRIMILFHSILALYLLNTSKISLPNDKLRYILNTEILFYNTVRALFVFS